MSAFDKLVEEYKAQCRDNGGDCNVGSYEEETYIRPAIAERDELEIKYQVSIKLAEHLKEELRKITENGSGEENQ